MAKDAVCGMEVSSEDAEQHRLYHDYDGKRYVFCSLACFQAFQMNPMQYISLQGSAAGKARCELCSKAIRDGDGISELSIRGTTFQFCCSTCASVYAHNAETGSVQSADHEDDVVKRLDGCGLLPWLKEAVDLKASDLFLSAGKQPVLKIYGSFKYLESAPLKEEELSKIINTFLPKEKLEEFRKGHEVDLSLDVSGYSRFRVNVFSQSHGDAVAFRPISYKIPTLTELNLPPVFYNLSALLQGLVLITGPTGSGKSTTLASLLNTINRHEDRHIITIEDPIEYTIPSKRSLVHQREVGWHTRSFSDGLRSALRENPDIIVVGELRDLESISLAIRAAETGQFVLGTLHSGTAIQAITRLLDVFDSERQTQIRAQLAQSLQAICSQRLIKRRDNRGMIVATEVLVAIPSVRNIIRQNNLPELLTYMETGRAHKMHTMQQSMQNLIDRELIDPQAVDHGGREGW